MPIVIDRHTGEVLSAPEVTQAQKDALWEVVVGNYAKKHPELFQQTQAADTEKRGLKFWANFGPQLIKWPITKCYEMLWYPLRNRELCAILL